jgi:hypothetical protein
MSPEIHDLGRPLNWICPPVPSSQSQTLNTTSSLPHAYAELIRLDSFNTKKLLYRVLELPIHPEKGTLTEPPCAVTIKNSISAYN